MQYALNSELRLLTRVYGIVVKLMQTTVSIMYILKEPYWMQLQVATSDALTEVADHTNYFCCFELMFFLIMVTSHKGALN